MADQERKHGAAGDCSLLVKYSLTSNLYILRTLFTLLLLFLQAASAIHSDIERGFICAEVMKPADLLELGGEAAVKAAGKMTQQGKGYIIQDKDVVLYRFNV